MNIRGTLVLATACCCVAPPPLLAEEEFPAGAVAVIPPLQDAKEQVRSVCISSDCRVVYLGTSRGRVLAHSTVNGDLLFQQQFGTDGILDMVIAPVTAAKPGDKVPAAKAVERIVVANEFGGIWTSNLLLKTAEVLRPSGMQPRQHLKLSSDGKLCAEYLGQPPVLVNRCDVINAEQQQVLPDYDCDDLLWSPDATELVLIRNGRVYFWTKATNELRTCRLHENIDGLINGPEPGRLVLGLAEKGIVQIDRGNWKSTRTIPWADSGSREFPARQLAVSAGFQDVVISESGGRLTLFEVCTKRPVQHCVAHKSNIVAVQFLSPERFISVDATGYTVIWDLFAESWGSTRAEKPRAEPDNKPTDLTQKQLTALWNQLASSDADAWSAVVTLAQHPHQTCDLISSPPRIEPLVNQLIDRLDSASYRTRFQAELALKRIGLPAESLLKRAVRTVEREETRQRIIRLLVLLGGPAQSKLRERLRESQRLRQLRCVRLLERFGDPQAVQLLRRLATDPECSEDVLAYAQAALKRIQRDAPSQSPSPAPTKTD